MTSEPGVYIVYYVTPWSVWTETYPTYHRSITGKPAMRPDRCPLRCQGTLTTHVAYGFCSRWSRFLWRSTL